MEYTYELAPKLKSLDEFLNNPYHMEITNQIALRKLANTKSDHEFSVHKLTKSRGLMNNEGDMVVAFVNPHDTPQTLTFTINQQEADYKETIEIAPKSVGYPFAKKYAIPLLSTVFCEKKCIAADESDVFAVYCLMQTDERRALVKPQLFIMGEERYMVDRGMFRKESNDSK
jgi:hypothetical protein